jgi:hypothetical protein
MASAIRFTMSLDAGDPSKVISPQMPHMGSKKGSPEKNYARNEFPSGTLLNQWKLYLQH